MEPLATLLVSDHWNLEPVWIQVLVIEEGWVPLVGRELAELAGAGLLVCIRVGAHFGWIKLGYAETLLIRSWRAVLVLVLSGAE